MVNGHFACVEKHKESTGFFDTLQIGNAFPFSSRAAAVFVMHVIGKVNCKNDAIQNGVIVSLVTRRRAFCMAEASAELERLRL